MADHRTDDSAAHTAADRLADRLTDEADNAHRPAGAPRAREAPAERPSGDRKPESMCDRTIPAHILPEVPIELNERALASAGEGITMVDARLPGMPPAYVDPAFEQLTGYTREEALGLNCRFLHGSDTDPKAAETVSAASRKQRDCVVKILNYRKDDTRFWNRLSITPALDANSEVTHNVGIQADVTARRLAEERLAAANCEMHREFLSFTLAHTMSPQPARLFLFSADGDKWKPASPSTIAACLYAYADGLSEALSSAGEPLELERVGEAATAMLDTPLDDGVQALVSLAENWAGGEPQDDVSALAIGRVR